MSYAFTKLSNVPAVAEFPEGANAVIETNGEIKRCPSSNTPKPLTYDYMPEGYPKKTMGTVTVMAEQALEFATVGSSGIYLASLTEPLTLVKDRTYTVSWDGTEYECVCFGEGKGKYLGNNSILGAGIDTGEPFVYFFEEKAFATLDTSASHTISVTTAEEVITPMAEEFLPANTKNTTVFYLINKK